MKEFVEITCPVGSNDADIFIGVVNQGIDSHLEGFTKSKFSIVGHRHVLNFHISELRTLVRRLEDTDEEEALLWAEDIRNLEEYNEFVKT